MQRPVGQMLLAMLLAAGLLPLVQASVVAGSVGAAPADAPATEEPQPDDGPEEDDSEEKNRSTVVEHGVSERSRDRMQMVVDTLEDVLASVENEDKEETAAFQNFTGWCREEVFATTGEIGAGQQGIESLSVQMKELNATIAELEIEVARIGKELKEATDELEQAENLRKEEAEKYAETSETNKESLKQMTEAIEILGSVKTRGGFLQNGILRRLRINDPGESQVILGMLKQMRDTFIKNGAEAKVAEERRIELHGKFRETKQAQIVALEQQRGEKKSALETSNLQVVEVERDLAKLQADVEKNEAHAKEVMAECDRRKDLWKSREEDRRKEKLVLVEAIKVLKSEGARKAAAQLLLQDGSRAGLAAASFLQVQQEERKHSAANFLARSSDSAIAGAMSKGDMDAARDAVAKLLEVLVDEQAADEEKKKYCEASIAEKETEEAQLSNELEKIRAAISEKESAAEVVVETLHSLNQSVAALEAQVAEARVLRKSEKATHAIQSHDRVMTLKVLEKAMAVLKSYYEDEDTSGKDVRTTGAISLLEEISADVSQEQKDAQAEEEEAASAFEEFLLSSRDEFDRLMEEITAQKIAKSRLMSKLSKDREAEAHASGDLSSVQAQLLSMHQECDELLANFDQRVSARGAEMDQLKDAMDILAGSAGFGAGRSMSSAALVQKHPAKPNTRPAGALQQRQ